jgi:hypothetical protein
VKDDPTILDDRETVELLAAQPQLLAIADAVRATQRKEGRAWKPRPHVFAAAAALAGLAAVFAFALPGASGGHHARVVSTGLDDLRGGPFVLYDPLGGYVPTLAGTTVKAYARSVEFMVNAKTVAGRDFYSDGRKWSGVYDFWQPGLRIARAKSGVASRVSVTVLHAPRLHGSALLQVLAGAGAEWKRVVYSTPMTLNALKPYWSRTTLSPTAWSGGCRKGPYWVSVTVSPAGTLWPEWEQPRFWSRPFTCRQ